MSIAMPTAVAVTLAERAGGPDAHSVSDVSGGLTTPGTEGLQVSEAVAAKKN